MNYNYSFFPLLSAGIRGGFLIFFAAILSCNTSNQPDTEGPHLKKVDYGAFKFKESFYDFGKINDGDTVSHNFIFTNSGKAPLVIKDISTSCGCTVVDWSNKSIAPQSSGNIMVQFSKHHDPGEHVKQLIINANTEDPYTVINIKAFVN